MDFSSAIKAVERFLNDILGLIIPGGVLVVGLQHFVELGSVSNWKLGVATTLDVLGWIATTYLAGHVIDQLCRTLWKRNKKRETSGSQIVFDNWIVENLSSQIPLDPSEAIMRSSKRSIAMSMSEEARDLSRRFKFLQLLCDGVATALLVIIVFGAGVIGFQTFKDLPLSSLMIAEMAVAIPLVVLMRRRAAMWEGRSDCVCFDVVIGEILKNRLLTMEQESAK